MHRGPPLAKLFSWVLMSALFRQVAFLVVALVLFDRLGRVTYGAIALGFSYLSVFAGLGEFGIRAVAWREVARHPAAVRELTGTYLGAKSLTGVASLLSYLALMPLLWADALPASIYLLFGVAILLNGGTFEFPLHGLNRMDLVARYSLAAYVTYVATCLAFVWSDDRAWLVPALFVLSMALLLVLEVRWFRSVHGFARPTVRPADVRRIAGQSWALGIGEVTNRLTLTYPIIILGFTVGPAAAGNYRIAELAYSFLAQFGHLLASAGYSRVSHLYVGDRREALRTVGGLSLWMGGGAILAGSCLLLVGPAAIQVVLGSAVEDDTLSALRLLGAALVFAAPVRFLKTLLASIDQQNMVLVVNCIALGVGASAGWLASIHLGVVGMAGAVLLAESAAAAVLVAVYRRALVACPERSR